MNRLKEWYLHWGPDWLVRWAAKWRLAWSMILPDDSLLARFQRWLRNYLPFPFRSDKREGEHLMRAFARQRKDVFFVQIGANDGQYGDPIHDFVTERGWMGVLVEPMPENFARLQETYRARPDLILENAAIAESEGEMTMWYVNEDGADLPDWVDLLGSLHEEVIRKHIDREPAIEAYFETRTVRTITLPSLFEKHGVQRIDVLVSDAEGGDQVVMKQLDLDTYRPGVLRFEYHHMPADVYEGLVTRLRAKGYHVYFSVGDIIAVQPDRGLWPHILLARYPEKGE